MKCHCFKKCSLINIPSLFSDPSAYMWLRPWKISNLEYVNTIQFYSKQLWISTDLLIMAHGKKKQPARTHSPKTNQLKEITKLQQTNLRKYAAEGRNSHGRISIFPHHLTQCIYFCSYSSCLVENESESILSSRNTPTKTYTENYSDSSLGGHCLLCCYLSTCHPAEIKFPLKVP